MKTLENKLIIYDSNCRICTSLKNIVVKLAAIPSEKIYAYKDVPEKHIEKIDPDRFKNAMALIDTEGEKTIYGEKGIAYIFSTKSRLVDKLINVPLIFKTFTFLYNTLALNRYVIALPKSQFQCDCYPDKVARYRWSYIIICVVLSIMLTMLFGTSLTAYFPEITKSEAALQMLLMAGSGWICQIVLTAIFLKDKWLDYVGNLSTIMVVGLIVLIPWMLMRIIFGPVSYFIAIGSVLLSSALMLRMHFQRVKFLQLSQIWTLTWFLCLQAKALTWIYIFHLKN